MNWRKFSQNVSLVSTYVVCERLSVMHKQVCVQLTSISKFLSKFSRKGLSGISDQKAPPPNEKLQIWDDQSLLRNIPPNEKFQIWDDQSLLQNTPPQMKNFRFEMTKIYSKILPPQWKTSDLRWPKFTPKYPPKMKNFRFEMTKVYSEIRPPQWKTSDLRWPKFTSKYPPPPENWNLAISWHFEYFHFWVQSTPIHHHPSPHRPWIRGDRMWRLICIPRGYHLVVIAYLK